LESELQSQSKSVTVHFEKKTLKLPFLTFKTLNWSPVFKKIQKATPLLPLAFVAIFSMASPFEDCIVTKLKGDEGLSRLIGNKAITFHNNGRI